MAGVFFHPTKIISVCLLLLSSPKIFCSSALWNRQQQQPEKQREKQQQQQPAPLECELYLAESTIPGAGIGVFTGVPKAAGDFLGNGDKAIPLVDAFWHNGFPDPFFNPTADYVWDGASMGMRLELYDPNDISAFWPGIDAMVNCHFGLLNLEKATPVYNEGGVHRSKHHGAGSISPYDAYPDGSSYVIRDIPQGGELFKGYGDNWFLHREWLGKIPLMDHYNSALQLMMILKEGCELLDMDPSILYEDMIQPIKEIWDSRMLNALYDFSWDQIETALEAEDIGVLLQPNATRSIDWLSQHGKCLDHIMHKQSTIDGAGAGAFAKRDLPKGTVITGTPVLVFPDISFFDMYYYLECPDESWARNVTTGPYGQQLLLNYCFGHPESSVVVCPMGSGVNYINHNQTRANVGVQWAKDGDMGHRDAYLERSPRTITDYSTRVAFDYVAIQDIAEGEELFLDYGDVWEQKFQKLRMDWEQEFDHTHLDNYVSASEYNALYPKDPLYTVDELHDFYPHPENLNLRCHYLVDEFRSEDGVFEYEGDVSELADNWHTWWGDGTGYACEVLLRVDDGASYVVRYQDSNSPDGTPSESRIVSNVPREAIKFFDNPYTTDIHMMGAFRQAAGIPDDILPDAWRRKAGENTNPRKDLDHITDDPCSRNPYRYMPEQKPPEGVQDVNYPPTLRRYLQSNVRGR